MYLDDPNCPPSSRDDTWSPVVVGDTVSIRKWLNQAPNPERHNVAGKVIKIWRTDKCVSGLKVKIRTGFLKSICLDSNWIERI